jgi:hypothetical protein
MKPKSDCTSEFSIWLNLVSGWRKNEKPKKYVFQPEIIDIAVPIFKDTCDIVHMVYR